MSSVVIFGIVCAAAAVLFLGCFFLALCRENGKCRAIGYLCLQAAPLTCASGTFRRHNACNGRAYGTCRTGRSSGSRSRRTLVERDGVAGGRRGVLRPMVLAAIPSVLGFAVAIRCVWDFGWTGHGTPAPVAPPKRLVVVGFYRYVRNPMYVGFAAGWIGLWIVFGHANPAVIAAVVAVALGIHLFVVFYEEPTLRSKFGADYENYCRNVRRWWPRLRPWE
jgi:hypothetical protein